MLGAAFRAVGGHGGNFTLAQRGQSMMMWAVVCAALIAGGTAIINWLASLWVAVPSRKVGSRQHHGASTSAISFPFGICRVTVRERTRGCLAGLALGGHGRARTAGDRSLAAAARRHQPPHQVIPTSAGAELGQAGGAPPPLTGPSGRDWSRTCAWGCAPTLLSRSSRDAAREQIDRPRGQPSALRTEGLGGKIPLASGA